MSTLIVGCGYLGRRVGRLLSGRGETVFGTVRSPGRAAELSEWGIVPVLADVLVPGTFSRMPQAERVLYCVGHDRSSGQPMRTVFVEGLRNVLDGLAGRVATLVYTSSSGVYGQNDGGWVTEESPALPVHEAGKIALEAESIALGTGTGDGRPAVILRLAGLYGPGRIPRRASLGRGEPIVGDPGKYLNLIHIDDAAQAAVAALDRGEAGRIYLACDDRPVERREYYGLAAALLGAPPPRYETPEAGSGAAGREDSHKRISNRRMREELGVVLIYPDITRGLPAALECEKTA